MSGTRYVAAERFDLRTIAPQPWKNGAGVTREIAWSGASAATFDWRISVAEVDRDAPFSAFPGVDRCITLLRGAGMRLRAHDGSIDHALTTARAPFDFPGDVALDATLVGGACSDFNVMTRRGAWRSEVRVQRAAQTLAGADALLLLCCVGAWSAGPGSTPLAPLQGLLWRGAVDTLHIEPAAVAGAATSNADPALLVVRLCHDRRP